MSLYGYKPKTKPALWVQLPQRGKTLCEVFAKEARDAERKRQRDERRRAAAEHFALARQQYKEAKRAAAATERIIATRKQPKRIAQRSASQKLRTAEYLAARRPFLAKRPNCEACPKMTGANPLVDAKPHPATDIHHKRGRLGKLLLDERHWLPCCKQAHDWIHRNPALARALNLLAQPGEWNRYEL